MSDDVITEYSKAVSGNGGLDAPNPFGTPTPESTGFGVFAPDPTEPRESTEVTQWVPHARVFIVGEDGNADYEDLLLKGANGKVVLGRKEIGDIRGTPAYKVYQEWMVPVKSKKKKAGG